MPRSARRASPTGFYHVTNRGAGQLPIFQSNREKARMSRLIEKEAGKHDVGVYAYCIMPDHYHFLVKAEVKELSSFIAVISTTYAQYYNQKRKTHGKVFQGRFRSQCIEKESVFWNCVRYIHQNPVNARLCSKPEDYPYSSFREYSAGKLKIICKEAHAYLLYHFDEREDFRRFHEASGGDWFADIDEEERFQKTEIARIQLKKMWQKYKIAEEEVLRRPDLCAEYEKQLEITLNIAGAEAKRIRKYFGNGKKEETEL